MKIFLVFVFLLPLAGCLDVISRDLDMESAAMAFSKAAEVCLLDVRDNNRPYMQSPNCTDRLKLASAAYTKFPNMQLTYTDEAVPRHAYIAESARTMAWIAAAISNANYRDVEPVIAIW